MNCMKTELSKIISDIVFDLFDQKIEATISYPDEKFGDYSCNAAMQLVGKLQKNPRIIAEQIADKLAESEIVASTEVAGAGFINVRVEPAALISTLEKQQQEAEKRGQAFGENEDGKDKTVVVEYPSPNMAKPYSVGHLRPGNQGWAVKQLMEATGWKTITDNHLGDYGTPFGVWVVGFKKFSSEEKLVNGGVYELGRIYIETKAALKEEEKTGKSELADEVQQWLLKLEQGDAEAAELSERFNKISLEHIHNVMRRLKISTEHELGEKFFVEKGKKAVKRLIDEGIAKQNDDGSVIVALDEFGIETPILLQKSNGAALYATTDLATIEYRESEWKPDRVIYAAGGEQQFHFAQLFALAKKLGVTTELIHLWFGTIDQKNEDGTREKMSSRKGVVLMEELLDEAEKRAREVVKDREVSEEDIKKVALGAIKFTDFAADRRTNILFDWQTMFNLTGYSGPYVQYAVVRLNKILGDNEVKSKDFASYNYSWHEEKPVLIKLLEYPEVVKYAADTYEPHRVAAYVYELARIMNRYYEKTPVATGEVSEDEKGARLALLKQVSSVMQHALNLLGIEVPSRM